MFCKLEQCGQLFQVANFSRHFQITKNLPKDLQLDLSPKESWSVVYGSQIQSSDVQGKVSSLSAPCSSPRFSSISLRFLLNVSFLLANCETCEIPPTEIASLKDTVSFTYFASRRGCASLDSGNSQMRPVPVLLANVTITARVHRTSYTVLSFLREYFD